MLNLRALSLAEWANASGGRHDLLVRAADAFDAVVARRPDLASVWLDLIRVVVASGDHARLVSTVRRAFNALHLDFAGLARLRARNAAP